MRSLLISLVVAALFQSFARGEVAYPWTGPVEVLMGGQEATSLTAEQAATPRAWRRLCNDAGTGYAMRECPIDVLSYVEGPVTVGTEAVQEPCSRPHGLEPADVGATRRISLVADGGGSCLDYAALELYVDVESRVVAVNLLLGSP